MSASAFFAAASVTPMDVPSGMRISMKSSGRDEVGKELLLHLRESGDGGSRKRRASAR